MHSYLHGHPALVQAVKRLERLNPDQFELFFQNVSSTHIESKDGEVDTLARSEDVGLAVRLIRDRRIGFSFTTSLEAEAIDRAIDAAYEIAQVMPEDPYVGLVPFGSSVYPDVDTYDSKGLAEPVSTKIDLARRLEAACRKSDARVTGVRKAAVHESRSEIHLVDSHGEHIQYQATMYSASVTCKAEQDGDSQMGGESGFSNLLEGLDIGSVGKIAAQTATELLGSGQAPTMKCPAVFRNSVMGELVEFLSNSFSAEEIDKGKSMLGGKQGERVFSEKLDLVDDGLLPGGYATSPFDGEGVPSRRTVLIEGGFMKGSLVDAYYARKLGGDPTGNSSRGIKSPPSISFSNLYIPAGKKSLEGLFDGIKKGIFITDLMGIHTANPVTGDFSVGASGILIENGKLTRPVRGFAVAGNVLEVFRRIVDTGIDLKFYGGVGAPSARVNEISVGGA